MMFRKFLARVFLFLAEACDPQLQLQLQEYERERDHLLRQIASQEKTLHELDATLDRVRDERNDALNQITELKNGIARISTQIGTDHTAGLSDADALRADLFGTGI